MSPKRDDKWCSSLAGKLIDGKWILDGFVGKGRIGFVYKAHHKDFPKGVRAVKLTFDGLKDGWEEELAKVMSLDVVDGVVHFHDLGHDNVMHGGKNSFCQYTVWDFISPGENLKAYLSRVERITTSFLVAVVERVLLVVHACEAQGVPRHGDLHSGNVLIGDHSLAKLDDALQPRAPIYVSDFGYGATGGAKTPKDDYDGLAAIINEMIPYVDYAIATATHRQILQAMQRDLGRLLREPPGAERRSPLDLLHVLADIKRIAQGGEGGFGGAMVRDPSRTSNGPSDRDDRRQEAPSVGQFQVSEMIGNQWEWWRRLFVPTVPARSKILSLDIPTVVTGPRGCGKTMLFRRLSERLVVECGKVVGLPNHDQFVAFYVNSNDFADAFSKFPEIPGSSDEARLTCYANLCVLADVLAVQSARAGRIGEPATDLLLSLVQRLLVPPTVNTLLVGEDRLERYRAVLEQTKWNFPLAAESPLFPGYAEMSQHRWLPRFLQQVRRCCPWIGVRSVLLFIDDFSVPRVSRPMQRVLNRLFLQRSPEFLAKVSTEAWSTFIPEDSSGKTLEDGDDYQLVDMGEESLFLPDTERRAFLDEVFARRLGVDPRVPDSAASLRSLLGRTGLTKTEFARRLRTALTEDKTGDRPPVAGNSQRRGRSRARVLYFGEDVFCDLWSGDTRTMIQLISDVIDQASESTHPMIALNSIPVDPALQDRVFRNRGGEWLNSHTRNEATDPARLQKELESFRQTRPTFSLQGQYGEHLKAIVEAFVAAARELLLGPMYGIAKGGKVRDVPRMAFRIEVIDEFRLGGLAQEIYRDLIRYGLFMRDSRGKSVRGNFVPRLYLRRLLLPFSTLALSKRDSVAMSCVSFEQLLLEPDAFRANTIARRASTMAAGDQITLPFGESLPAREADSIYDDVTPLEGEGLSDASGQVLE